MMWNLYCFAHKTLRHLVTTEEILTIVFAIIFFLKKKKNDQHRINNSSYKECDKSAHRHDARLWKCHAFTHTSWIPTDEILTWPKCILWHGWCTFHLTADKAESLAQVSVNKPIQMLVLYVCKKGKNGKSAYILSYTDKAVHACELKKMYI